MNWKGKKVLVTGAEGFIGSHLAERLVDLGASTKSMVLYNSFGSYGWLDKSFLNKEMEIFFGDVRDNDSVHKAMKGVDIVFHLAALISIPYSYDAPRSYIETNINGSMNIFQNALQLGIKKVIHTSTSEVYGTAQYVPIDEKHSLQGQSPYSASKIGAEKIAEAYYCSFSAPIVTVRPFNTFGPRQSTRAVIPTIITQILEGKDIVLGNLKPSRDFNYIDNTVDGFISIAEEEGLLGEVINIGYGEDISIGDLAKLISNILDLPLHISTDEARTRPDNSEVERLLSDTSKAGRLFNWSPKVSLKEGLGLTAEWIKGNLAEFKTGQYMK